ncbi:hypothetical protein Bca52824_087858 [Brassica carinata]|uniref:Uncharacterized protein n=1 Tax=Brassica carinata TaxID=52824 RepID=A0A8X7PBH5_BRACI|nr:hypothetical protein Bca52824_087858 [Brassica carinata]
MPGGVPKLPKIQPADIQATVGWGVAAAAGAIWVVQIGHGQCRPEIFRDAKPVPADESSQIPMAQQDVDGEIDSSDDSMPPPPLEAYTNRLRPFGVQFDAETDSDS